MSKCISYFGFPSSCFLSNKWRKVASKLTSETLQQHKFFTGSYYHSLCSGKRPYIYVTFVVHQMKQVPIQSNLKDCGCFTIFFGKKFLLDPESTMGLIKVIPTNSSIWSLLNSNTRHLFLPPKPGWLLGVWKILM